jgi:hypothetical protein
VCKSNRSIATKLLGFMWSIRKREKPPRPTPTSQIDRPFSGRSASSIALRSKNSRASAKCAAPRPG